MKILYPILQCILVPAFSPLMIGVIGKIKARLQNRVGASIFQPYRDIWKLLHKDEVISRDASWIFRFSPYIIFTVTLVVSAGIPIFNSYHNIWTGDILVIVYTLAIGTFFLALAGMDTGSAFGGFGSSREMTVSALAEGGLIFALLAAALVHGTMNAVAIAEVPINQARHILPLLLAFGGFFIALLAENARFPFDNPATHLELTMIHEAMILEYSGKRLAMMEWAARNKLLIFAALGAKLFFPSPSVSIFLIRMFAIALAIALIESTVAKWRFFRLPDLLLTSCILSMIAISLIR